MLKPNGFHRALALAALLVAIEPATASQAGKPFQLRKITTSSVCLVQTSTESPIGALVSEHDTKKEACQAAKDLYDASASDQTKCWAYGPATTTGCKALGIDLP
jgi:hypothetical protein